MSKHTPGPWRINKYGGIGTGPLGITEIIIDSQGWSDGNLSDVELIAAAPDLLDACRALVFEISAIARGEFGQDWADRFGPLYRLIETSQAAIAKAEGAQ